MLLLNQVAQESKVAHVSTYHAPKPVVCGHHGGSWRQGHHTLSTDEEPEAPSTRLGSQGQDLLSLHLNPVSDLTVSAVSRV